MRRPLLLTLALVGLTIGPADGQPFKQKTMEDLVQQILEERAGVEQAEVECPVSVPLGAGNRSSCAATATDGSKFVVELIQTDDEGGVKYTVSDERAQQVLEPLAESFFELWRAGKPGEIWDTGHPTLRSATGRPAFRQLLTCTLADFDGLESMGEGRGAVLNRGDGSGQLITNARFGAGPGEVTLNYMRTDAGYELTGVSLPVPDLDLSTISSDDLMRQAALLFDRVDAEDWETVLEMFSHEAREANGDEEFRAALSDRWQLGPVERVEMTAFGRNAGRLPIVFVRVARANGSQRAWLVFRSCGEDWKIRVMELVDPSAQVPAAPLADVQTGVIQDLQQRGVDISLECPGSEVVVLPGVVYTCEASHASGLTAPLELRIGEEGDFTWELLAGDAWAPLFE